MAAEDRTSDGIPIFHHGDRNDCCTVLPEYPRFYSCSRICGSKQDRAGVYAGLRCAWYNDGDLLCTEYGAGKYTRIRKGFKSATLIGFIYAVVTGVIIFFVGKYMTIFFVSENVNQIMEYVDIYLRCVSVSFLPLVIVNLYRNGIQGMGYGLLPMTAGIAELVGRSGASLIASHFGSYMGICLASPAAWVLAGTLLLIMYFEIMKGKKDRNLKNR